MEVIQCEILQGEVLFKSYYVFNAEILEGNLSSTVGMISNGIRINEKSFTIPVSIVKLGTGFRARVKLYADLRLCTEDERRIITGTNSGTIQFQSPDHTVILHGNKHLLFVDNSGVQQAFPVMLALARTGGQAEVYYLPNTGKAASAALRSYVKRMDFPLHTIRVSGERRISKILTSQTMGTRIMAFCNWPDFSRIRNLARQAGYSHEEIQGFGFGEKEDHVFCARCYARQRKLYETEMICAHCDTPLIVSNHYSPRLESFMGYVSINS